MKELPLVQCCVPLTRPALSQSEAEGLERVFKALADQNRVRMLNMLLDAAESICVCDFQEALSLKQATASYHLKQLADAGLVERERKGTFAHYRLRPGSLAQVSALLG